MDEYRDRHPVGDRGRPTVKGRGWDHLDGI